MFADVSVALAQTGVRPTIGVRANRISGGGDDQTVRTFNPLYARAGLISEANFQTYANLTDIYPYVTVRPSRTISLTGGVDIQWRTSRTDGFYAPPVTPLFDGTENGHSGLGHVFTAQADWVPSSNFSLTLSAVRYAVRGFLKSAGAQDTTWIGLWTTFRL